jgi:response regulator of citrate/malate metabolism
MSAVAAAREPGRARAEWRVMIVEDNVGVASLHRRIVDSVPHLRTAHVARNGEEAYRALPAVNPDLVILDLTMPGGDGLSFLRRLRREGIPIDVIVVTASRAGRIVQDATHLGVLEYLIKPFSPQRLRLSLAAFLTRHRALTSARELSQRDVDLACAASARPRPRLPKGLKETTLRAVLAALDSSPDAICADLLGAEVGVARVTARRYLEYLESIGAVELVRLTCGPGRPRNRYRLRRGGPWGAQTLCSWPLKKRCGP